jgi:hypothetical protein
MSSQTSASIYSNLGRALGLQESEIRALRAKDELVQQKLRDMFGANEVICKLTVNPNGRIESVAIKKSSGSDETMKWLQSLGSSNT